MEDTRPKLHDIQAFKDVLSNYQASEHAKRVLADIPFVAVSGIAGGGRNTVIRRLVAQHNFIFAISDTTRPPKFRDGRMEQDGIDYYFRSETDMLRDIRSGEFIEAELIHNQQVSGTSVREVERAASTGKIPIHDFEYGGANAVARVKPDAHIIGLLPPSYDEWIRRFKSRETIHKQEFINRLTTAKDVLENMLSRPYFKLVINDDVDQCAEDIRQIVETNHYPPQVERRARAVAKDILGRVEKMLVN
jgi:guanylate kinase